MLKNHHHRFLLISGLTVIFLLFFLSSLIARPDFNVNPKEIERGLSVSARRIPLYITNNGDGEDLEWELEIEAEVDGWISISNEGGTVRRGERDSSVVWLNGGNLEEEHVYAFLNFTSNDPTRDEFTVPVAAHTVAYPRIEYVLPDAWNGGWRLFDMNLVFPNGIFWSDDYSFEITVYNPHWRDYHDGGATVEVEDMISNNGYFQFDPTEYSMNHNSSRRVTVTFTAEQIGQNTAEITSVSNVWDPKELFFRISAVVSPVFRMGTQIPDFEIDEDSDEFLVADLDTIFVSSSGDVDYQVLISEGLVIRIERNGEFYLHPRPDWNGVSEVHVTASIADSTLTDTFTVWVNPFPDPPDSFSLLIPADSATVHPSEFDTLFIWESAYDPDGDTVTYDITITPVEMGLGITWENLIDTSMSTDIIGDVMNLEAGGMFSWYVVVHDDMHEVASRLTFTNYLAPASMKKLNYSPSDHLLVTVFPNPFNSSLNISVYLESPDRLRLSVYNMNGRLVTVLNEGNYRSGDYDFSWNPLNVASGKYLLRVDASGSCEIIPIILIR